MTSTLGKLKTGFGRKREGIVSIVSSSEKVPVPQELKDLHAKLYEKEGKLKKLKSHLNKYFDGLKIYISNNISLAKELNEFDDKQTAKQMTQVSTELEASGNTEEEKLKQLFTGSIEKFLQQFSTIEHRMRELENRRIDVDRYNRELKSLMESGKETDEDKKNRLEKKLKIANDGHSSLQEEILKDMPLLIESSNVFVEDLSFLVLQLNQEFYTSALNSIITHTSGISTFKQRIAKLDNYPESITHESVSASVNYLAPGVALPKANKGIFSKGKGESEIKITENPSTNSSSSSNNNNPVVPMSTGEYYDTTVQEQQQSHPYVGHESTNSTDSYYSFAEESEPNQDSYYADYSQTNDSTEQSRPPTQEFDVSSVPTRKSVRPARPPRQSKMIRNLGTAKALYTFQAMYDTELSFNEGDTLTMLIDQPEDGAWYKAELNGKQGLVPANYVDWTQ